jgi:hypothetical protein
MISPEKMDFFRVLHFQGHKKANCFELMRAAINVIA